MNTDPDKQESGRRRAAVDAGSTGDKVPVADPAAAPMETDAETAGAAIPAAAAAADRRRQQEIVRDNWAGAGPTMAGADPAARGRRGPRAPVLAVIAVAAAMLAAILLGLA